jgi:hypothetical protein
LTWEQSSARRWYRQAKETKRGGKGDRESEHPSSTCEAGEVFPRRPGGGKGDAELRGRWRET